LSGYQIIFMVNGQYDIANVAYGTKWGKFDLSTMTSLDLEGVNNWVAVYEAAIGSNLASYNGYAILKGSEFGKDNFNAFNFSNTELRNIEDEAKDVQAKDQTFALVLVANFQEASKTSYAIFDANDYS